MHLSKKDAHKYARYICENDVRKYANYIYEEGCIEPFKIHVNKKNVNLENARM